jgi:hypothetical protein
METFNWQWRESMDLHEKALVVAGRTEYPIEEHDTVAQVFSSSHNRMLGDPNVLGLAAKLIVNETHLVVWSQGAWEDYEGMAQYIRNQMEWLTELAEGVLPRPVLRHNVYRLLTVDKLPLPWSEVRNMIQEVRRVSPLGADVFPELSDQLGLPRIPKEE